MQRINSAYTQTASIKRFRTLGPFWTLALIASILVVPKVSALPEAVPRDVLKLRPDGYVYADYPGVFDDAEGEGITIEAWIYLTERPGDWDRPAANFREGQWIIFAKPSSYFVTITGRDLGSGIRRGDQESTTYVDFGVQRQRGSGLSTGIWGRVIPPNEFSLRRWVHIAYQISVKANHTITISYYDGRSRGSGRFDSAISRTDAPLLIGGSERATLKNSWKWESEYGSMKGYIDEVRVSKGFRYGEVPRRTIRPKRGLRADGRTIALWRFEEGRGATRYADSSGNGYTLRAGGSLAVEARDKLATTWGSMKRRALEGK